MQVTGNLRVKRGIYQMVFDYQDADGKRRQKSESTGLPEKGNKRRAQKMLEERMEELSKLHTASLEAKNVLFLSFMNSWLDDTMSYKVQPNTLSQYKMIFNGYIAKYKPFYGVKIQDVTPTLIQSYYNNELKAGLSSNTVHKHHANIHKCLAYAVRLGFIPSNPSDQTELPPKKKYTGAKAYTPEQTKELLQIFHKDPLETPVYIAATYGLRRSEVCGLRWADVDFDAGIIYVRHTAVVDNGKIIYADHTKTATSNRQLPLTQNMRVYLLETKKRQEMDKKLLGSNYVDTILAPQERSALSSIVPLHKIGINAEFAVLKVGAVHKKLVDFVFCDKTPHHGSKAVRCLKLCDWLVQVSDLLGQFRQRCGGA